MKNEERICDGFPPYDRLRKEFQACEHLSIKEVNSASEGSLRNPKVHQSLKPQVPYTRTASTNEATRFWN